MEWRKSCARLDWATPDWLYDLLDAEFGFDLDAAATVKQSKAALYFGPDHELRDYRNALDRTWDDGRHEVKAIWLNPPYGKDVGVWVEKAYRESRREGVTVVVLVNSQTDTLWFRDYIQRAVEVRFCTGRVGFVDPDTGLPAHRSVNRSMIVVFTAGHEGPPRYSVVDYRPGVRQQLSILG